MPIRASLRPALAGLVLLVAPAIRSQSLPEADAGATVLVEVEVRDDLAYADRSRDARRNRLDLYLPRGVDSPPLLMFVHGGTWMAGTKELHAFVGRAFASRGIATAVINYRLSPFARHPAHVQDCAAAFAYLRDNAGDLGFDREAMFLMGHSAGAHLVALLTLDPRWLEAEGVPVSAVGGVIAASAPFDVRRDNSIFRGVFGKDPEERERASPIVHVHGDAPPFLVLWAERELMYLGDDNEAMVERMEEVGLPHRAQRIDGHGHVSYLFRIGKEDDPVTPLVRAAIDDWTAK